MQAVKLSKAIELMQCYILDSGSKMTCDDLLAHVQALQCMMAIEYASSRLDMKRLFKLLMGGDYAVNINMPVGRGDNIGANHTVLKGQLEQLLADNEAKMRS